ncbi:hypothetical protein UA08_06023 [Talaromyces atroroseus]|uniref:Enoyl-CoA delta isomerase 1, peroxisomal n=1 Tax=Talaromyces atroroseus TaxID=1441469 RepID=A0A225ADY8_TALAT|nr:hypothetical protein UA08_06023 [Talaromyces atroroseus]OKL58700.1 hypothetical protein UA08_06023 [Talaromyces atroroseus]
MPKQLFTVPVPSSTDGGNFSCTVPSGREEDKNIYLLTFTSPAENRLTPEFIEAFLLSLDIIEHGFPKGVLITTSGIQKFFSNGLDLQRALSFPGFLENYLYKLFRRLLTYPMPTIALVNGHAFAGGFMTAMYHDYRVQNPKKGFLCLNEIALGIPLTPPMRSVFLEKIKDASLLRSVILEGRRFTGQQALDSGIVDALGGLPETIQLVHERGLLQIVKSPAFVALKERMWSRVLDSIDNLSENDASDERRHQRTESLSAEGKTRAEQWDGRKESKL